MTIKTSDRIFETTTSTGTGTINLAGPVAGFKSFVDGVGGGAKVPYTITQSEGGEVISWECGIGTITDATVDTLSRNTILESSNSNAPVNFGAGTKNVYLGFVADIVPVRDENLNLIEGFGPITGTANALVLTLPVAPKGYSDGMIIRGFATAANTGSATINANGNGAKTMKINGVDLPANTFVAGTYFSGVYRSSTGFVELTTPVQAPLAIPTGSIFMFPTMLIPTGFLKSSGQAVSRLGDNAALFKTLVTDAPFTNQTFTMTIASPAVFTKSAHGFYGGERVRLSTTGALPTGFNNSTDYYVLYLTANTFSLSSTFDGTAIASTGSQSGVHSYLQSYFGLGDGSTTFNLPSLNDDQFIRGVDSGSSRTIGTKQQDAFQGHQHEYDSWNTPNAGNSNTTGGGGTQRPRGNTVAIVSDGINGTPRVSSETRPKNVALLYCIKQ